MSAKQQYKQAYRVARLLSTWAREEQDRLVRTLTWNFNYPMFYEARLSVIIRGQ